MKNWQARKTTNWRTNEIANDHYQCRELTAQLEREGECSLSLFDFGRCGVTTNKLAGKTKAKSVCIYINSSIFTSIIFILLFFIVISFFICILFIMYHI